MKAKSEPNIKEATLQAYKSLPDEFRGNDLHRLVKMITRRSRIHTDSSLRKLRVLRSKGKVNYIMAKSKEESLYKKV